MALKKLMELAKDKSNPEMMQKKNQMFALIRNMGNMEAGKDENECKVIPIRRQPGTEANASTHTICIHCKGYFDKSYYCRHEKTCFAKGIEPPKNPISGGRSNALITSLIYVACHQKYEKFMERMALKEEVLYNMRADATASEVMKDILIISWGDCLLKSTPKKRSKYHITAKLRRCAKFVSNMRTINPDKYSNLMSCLHPEAFDDVLEATRMLSGYDPSSRAFSAPTTALQFGAHLKQITDLAIRLLFQKKIQIKEDERKTVVDALERFWKFVDSAWSRELGSLAKKNLDKNSGEKLKLLPLTEDILNLRKLVDSEAANAFEALQERYTKKEYSILAECTLLGTIIHNRKRVGDVQFLELDSYHRQRERERSHQEKEFLCALSDSEKVIMEQYIRIVTIGKGSRSVPVLIRREPMLKYFDLLYKIRNEKSLDWFQNDNTYLFAYPRSHRWIDGTAVIRKYGKKCGAKYPKLLSSTRLRKQIATITQILALSRPEIEQLATFLGHKPETFHQFYR